MVNLFAQQRSARNAGYETMKSSSQQTDRTPNRRGASRWATFWSSVHDTLSTGRKSRRRNKLVGHNNAPPQPSKVGTTPSTPSTTSNRSEGSSLPPMSATTTSAISGVYHDDTSVTGTATVVSSSSSSFPLKHVLMVVSLPPQIAPPGVVDYGHAKRLSQNRQHFDNVPLRKKWVSDNGSVSSISTMTMDPALRQRRISASNFGSRSGGGSNSKSGISNIEPRQDVMFTMDSILCDDSKTTCCSSITMAMDEHEPREGNKKVLAIAPTKAAKAAVPRGGMTTNTSVTVSSSSISSTNTNTRATPAVSLAAYEYAKIAAAARLSSSSLSSSSYSNIHMHTPMQEPLGTIPEPPEDLPEVASFPLIEI